MKRDRCLALVQHALVYFLWMVSTLLAVVDIVATRRFLLRLSIAMAERTGGIHGTGPFDHWTVEAIDRFGILILGAISLIFVIFCERFYTDGAASGHLGKRFGIVTGVQVAILAIGLL